MQRDEPLRITLAESSRQVADRLVVSVRTVENHLQHIYDKLGVGSRAQLESVLRPKQPAPTGRPR